MEPPDVVIIGCGPAGQIAARPLLGNGGRVTAIDMNQHEIRHAKELGFQADVGDATQHKILEHARLRECKAVVIAIPHCQSAITIFTHFRKYAPQAHIIVRSRYAVHTCDFVDAGAHAVAGDKEQVRDNLARHLSRWLDTQGSAPTQANAQANTPA